MKALVGTFNQEKALVGAFSVITNLRMDLRFKLSNVMHPGFWVDDGGLSQKLRGDRYLPIFAH